MLIRPSSTSTTSKSSTRVSARRHEPLGQPGLSFAVSSPVSCILLGQSPTSVHDLVGKFIDVPSLGERDGAHAQQRLVDRHAELHHHHACRLVYPHRVRVVERVGARRRSRPASGPRSRRPRAPAQTCCGAQRTRRGAVEAEGPDRATCRGAAGTRTRPGHRAPPRPGRTSATGRRCRVSVGAGPGRARRRPTRRRRRPGPRPGCAAGPRPPCALVGGMRRDALATLRHHGHPTAAHLSDCDRCLTQPVELVLDRAGRHATPFGRAPRAHRPGSCTIAVSCPEPRSGDRALATGQGRRPRLAPRPSALASTILAMGTIATPGGTVRRRCSAGSRRAARRAGRRCWRCRSRRTRPVARAARRGSPVTRTSVKACSSSPSP